MKKKIAEILCVTAVISALLAGCSGGLSGIMDSDASGEDEYLMEKESTQEQGSD